MTTRKIDAASTIAFLKFLKSNVFTPENIAKAAEMGKDLGEMLADVFLFAQQIGEQFPKGSRDLNLEADIHEAGCADVWNIVRQAVK